MEKTRNHYWDNIKGILMLLTVFAHVLFQLQSRSDLIEKTVDYIYMFHMPAFVFVSGFFGKSEHSRSKESIFKLIFLYVIFNSLMCFMFGYSSLLMPVYSYWYLLALIAWRLTAHHIAKFKELRSILLVLFLFIGFFPSIDNTLSAARILCFLPYYMAGYTLSKEKSAELEKKSYIKRLPVGIGCIAAAAVIAFFSYDYFMYTDDALQMAAYSDPTDAVGRIMLLIISFLMIYALRNLSVNKEIPFLTKFGRNSIWIFILHRPFTLWISSYIERKSAGFIISAAIISSIAICVVFSSSIVAKFMSKFSEYGVRIFTVPEDRKFNISKLALLLVPIGFIASIVIQSYDGIKFEDIVKFFKSGGRPLSDEELTSDSDDPIYPVMSAEQNAAFDNAFRITFAGDLILLEDQVKRAYDGKSYDFSPVFEYAEKYISSADLAVGVFEGPMAGEAAGYSSSNFDDGKELYLNFPDSFADAVKNAGFDLVTTANNHLLDKGIDGAMRTLDVLDRKGLDHIGSYRNAEEKSSNRVKLIEKDGLKIAFLAYTYGCNYYSYRSLTDDNLSHLTSIISYSSGAEFETLKSEVEKDFEAAKAMSPDLIVVLPHIGTQFSNEPDGEQEAWFEVFKENGADIILGDHPHVVEPVLIEEYEDRDVFTAYCPGNFANIYRDDQGDTSVLVDVFIDRDTKKIVGGGIVPLYTQSSISGNFRALPIGDILTDATLSSQLSTDDLERAKISNGIITSVIFGSEMDITSVTDRLYFDKNGFVRKKTSGLELTAKMKNSTLFKAIEKSDTICFVGDSVTEGTKNGGCPWYEPIEEHIPDKNVLNYSKGGCTVSYMVDYCNEIPTADLYVIALGTNDVRYRAIDSCAMTPDEYTSRIEELVKNLHKKNGSAEFVFIAPWYSTDGDPFCDLSFSEKTELNNSFSDALKKYCDENDYGYINANPYIADKLNKAPDRNYLLDHIHPNSTEGVKMYSEAVLLN